MNQQYTLRFYKTDTYALKLPFQRSLVSGTLNDKTKQN